jgi:hypothetical protein
LLGHSSAYHSEHLPCDARQHSWATGAYRGALVPGCLTAGITHPQPLATHKPPQHPDYSPTPHDICWYHWNFRDEAAGKLHQRMLTAANVCTTSCGCLFITDRISKQRYLVDTASDLCVFPRKLLPGRRDRTDYTLYGANGTTIPTYGWTSRSLNLGLHRDFTWRFVIADAQLPIIGVDLLSHYGLLVDCRNNRLLEHCPRPASSHHLPSPV